MLVGEDHHAVGQYPHQLAELFLALAQQAPRLLALGHVLQRPQHAAAAGFVDTAGRPQVHHQCTAVHRQQRQQHVHLYRLAGAQFGQQLFGLGGGGRVGRHQQLIEAVPAPGLGRAAAEQAIDLVGIAAQPGGRVQFPGADAGQLMGFLHPGQRLVAAQLGQILGGAVDGDQQAGVVAVVADGVGAQLHLPQRAIAQLQLSAQDAQLLGRLADRLQLGLQGLVLARRPQGVDGLFQQLVAVPAEGAAGGGVGIEDRQRVQVVDEDRPGVALEHLPQAQLGGLLARMGMQHVFGQRAQQQIEQARAGQREERALQALPQGRLLRIGHQRLHHAVGGDHPGQRHHQIAQHHPAPVTAQRLRHPRVGNWGVAGRFCGHGRGG